MVGNAIGQVETAEPPIRQVEVDLLAEPPLRADPEAVPDQEHPDHQLGIDRRPTDRTVERRETRADLGEVDKPVDRSQQVIRRDMLFERELVEQRALRHLPRSHHRLHAPPASERMESAINPRNKRVFQHNRSRADPFMGRRGLLWRTCAGTCSAMLWCELRNFA